MRAALIVNPRSGRADPGARLALARRLASAAGVPMEVAETKARGHAADLAAAFARDGCDRVIVWGGDGTINEAAGPLIGADTILGIVRAGSGDGLGRSLGVPRPEPEALAMAVGAEPRRIDVGWLGDRHFLSIGGVGVDAAVAEAFNRRTSRGLRGYVVEVLRQFGRYRSAEYELDLDGERQRGARFLIAFANAREYGNGLRIAPDADPADGALNLVMAVDGSTLGHLWRARRLYWRPLAPARGLERRLVRSAVIRSSRLLAHVDGETFEVSGELRVSIQPGALRVAVSAPPGTTSGRRRG